jgi:hypothetical protein
MSSAQDRPEKLVIGRRLGASDAPQSFDGLAMVWETCYLISRGTISVMFDTRLIPEFGDLQSGFPPMVLRAAFSEARWGGGGIL